MAKTQLRAGAELDTLTRAEMAETIDAATRNWYQERARGLSPARFEGSAAVVSSAVTLPAAGAGQFGPKVGFYWKVERITAFGLGTGDVLQVFRSTAVGTKFLGVCTATAPTMPGTGKGLILQGEETLVFSGTSLTATGYISVNGEAIEVAASDFYKLA